MFEKPNVRTPPQGPSAPLPSDKLLVGRRSPADIDAVRQAGCTVLAEYPDSLLVRASAQQRQRLADAHLEVTEVERPAVQLTGTSFHFADALTANEMVPIPPAATNRKAYYLVQLAGPAHGDWMREVRALQGSVEGSLPGATILVGLLPAKLDELRQKPWVEGVTPYRPAMKVAGSLRPNVGPVLNVAQLASLAPSGQPSSQPPEFQQVQITVFPGESTATVAEQVRAGGGTVLKESAGSSVTAVVPPQTISRLAADPGVQAIIPHRFPRLHNDRAASIMGAPVTVIGHVLRGTDQIVAIADSGLDTGNLGTLHEDIRGRVVALLSLPISSTFLPYAKNAPPFDDGPADVNSAHGTHVTGSVLGDGSAATRVNGLTNPPGTSPVVQGLAPEARVHFQAVEQKVQWKTTAELAAHQPPLAPFDQPWPPPAVSLWGLPDNLGDLFAPAYTAGARVLTNSWGSPGQGEYTQTAREVDAFMWQHRDVLILFSAGNEGADDGAGGIALNSLGSPASAKNCLTVGACENRRPHGSKPTPGIDGDWNSLADGLGQALFPSLPAGHVSGNPDGMCAFSSRGPAADGRIKPDLVAPGSNILSARSQAFAGANGPLWGDLDGGDPLAGLYCWSGGTSMSTPLTAGTAALVRQHLVDQRQHFQASVKPSGALLKALLINGAVAMAGAFSGEIPTAAGPNPVNGYGRVNLGETLIPNLQETLFDDEPAHAVESMQTRSFAIDVAAGAAQPLKVTLVWTDAPSPAGFLAGAGGVQNRLYLQVVRPDGTVLDGDVTAFPVATNNVQQVVVPQPAAGTYEVRVRGVSVMTQAPGAAAGPNPRQDFALAVSGGTNLRLNP